MSVKDIEKIKETVSHLGAKYGAERIFLFGSYARGEATENSDVDLRIDKGKIRGLQMGGLLIDIEDSLGVSVDLITTSSLNEKFLSDIKKEEVLLYEA
jgi:predicted nucleotidyltransferase